MSSFNVNADAGNIGGMGMDDSSVVSGAEVEIVATAAATNRTQTSTNSAATTSGSGSGFTPPPASNNEGEHERVEVVCNVDPELGTQTQSDDGLDNASAAAVNLRHGHGHWNAKSKYFQAFVVLALVACGTGIGVWERESQKIKKNQATAIMGKSSKAPKSSKEPKSKSSKVPSSSPSVSSAPSAQSSSGPSLSSQPSTQPSLNPSSSGAPSPTPTLSLLPTLPGPQTASYDAVLQAPKCNAGSSCDSGGLLDGRGIVSNGNEPNYPNTLNSCTDGNAGSYHVDESVDRIVVTQSSGSPYAFTVGDDVTISATVWCYVGALSQTYVDFYYASDASNPVWNQIGSRQNCAYVSGETIFSASYTLPQGTIQAVRVNSMFANIEVTPASCTSSGFSDTDDLVITVRSAA